MTHRSIIHILCTVIAKKQFQLSFQGSRDRDGLLNDSEKRIQFTKRLS